jgi:hypothetical protein
MESLAVIKFYFKSWKTATEAYQDLKNLYGDDWCTSLLMAYAFSRRQGIAGG